MMPLEGYTVDYAEPDNGKENFLDDRSTNEVLPAFFSRFGDE